jgi:flagellar biosynthesis chaperone FliJ
MVQLEALEKTIDQQQKELKRLNGQISQQAEAFIHMKQDLESRLEKVQSLENLKEHVCYCILYTLLHFIQLHSWLSS